MPIKWYYAAITQYISRSHHAAITQRPRSYHAATTQPPRSHHAATTQPPRSHHAATTQPSRSHHAAITQYISRSIYHAAYITHTYTAHPLCSLIFLSSPPCLTTFINVCLDGCIKTSRRGYCSNWFYSSGISLPPSPLLPSLLSSSASPSPLSHFYIYILKGICRSNIKQSSPLRRPTSSPLRTNSQISFYLFPLSSDSSLSLSLSTLVYELHKKVSDLITKEISTPEESRKRGEDTSWRGSNFS